MHKKSRLGNAVVPSGMVTAVLNTVTHRLSFTIAYQGLSGHITVAHFHGPAEEGKDAPAILTIAPPYETGMHRVVTISPAMENYLKQDKVYINLHTIENIKGEARAHLIRSKVDDKLDQNVKEDPLGVPGEEKASGTY
ncbi:CHRD domain-containing protein [Entomobacter blattae]|uniref:CHRD domain-containing protein n=1 Tax=Entomobacter blattae TaxID=2762277 RepID=UPI00193B5171|nr:CHRD domain-containing protein [Entomobacter blattae]